jgi:hypothetical protein
MATSTPWEMEKVKLYTGTRIYYGGDMANQSDFGTITAIQKDRWGVHVSIILDDGRQTVISSCMFSPKYLGHGGTRFVTEQAYMDYREEQMAVFREFASRTANP